MQGLCFCFFDYLSWRYLQVRFNLSTVTFLDMLYVVYEMFKQLDGFFIWRKLWMLSYSYSHLQHNFLCSFEAFIVLSCIYITLNLLSLSLLLTSVGILWVIVCGFDASGESLMFCFAVNCSWSCYLNLLVNLLISGSLRDVCVLRVMHNCDLSENFVDVLYFILRCLRSWMVFAINASFKCCHTWILI